MNSSTRALWLLPLLLIYGCSTVSLVEPVGSLIKDSDAKDFSGVWMEGENAFEVSYDVLNRKFTVVYLTSAEDKKMQKGTFTVRDLGEITQILLVEEMIQNKIHYTLRLPPKFVPVS